MRYCYIVFFSSAVYSDSINKMDSKGPAFFMQVRIGQDFKPFKLIKFRTMSVPKQGEKREFNPGDSLKITKVGNLLRKSTDSCKLIFASPTRDE